MSEKIVFLDQIGRTIIGEQVSLDSTTLTVHNPAMINVNQMQNGQLQVQIFPLYFPEFLVESQRSKGTTWKFNLAQITLGVGIVVDTRLVEQYDRVVGGTAAKPVAAEAPTIKLFDQ